MARLQDGSLKLDEPQRFVRSVHASNVVAHVRAGDMAGADNALRLAEQQRMRLPGSYYSLMSKWVPSEPSAPHYNSFKSLR